jgi:hypothetical protein
MPNQYLVPATVRCACPGCNNVRKETNHWFLIIPSTHPEELYTIAAFAIELLYQSDNLLPVCGEACLLKLLSELIKKARPVDAEVIPHKPFAKAAVNA